MPARTPWLINERNHPPLSPRLPTDPPLRVVVMKLRACLPHRAGGFCCFDGIPRRELQLSREYFLVRARPRVHLLFLLKHEERGRLSHVQLVLAKGDRVLVLIAVDAHETHVAVRLRILLSF